MDTQVQSGIIAGQQTLERWLQSQRSARTERAYRQACADLATVTGKPAWSAGAEDLKRWLNDMQRRALSPATQAARLGAISSYHRYIETDANPAAGLGVKRTAYSQARALSADEARALISAIETTTPRGWRDLGLISGYLLTARRPGEWRGIRWGDIVVEDLHIYYQWYWRGETHQDELPRPVWDAIHTYLTQAGRLDNIQPNDAIFTALSEVAERLPTVQPAALDAAQPISDREACRILSHYCRKAGLNGERIDIRALRNTAALLRQQAGENTARIARMLGIKRLDQTTNLLNAARENAGSSWLSVAEMLGLPDDSTVAQNKPERKQRRRKAW